MRVDRAGLVRSGQYEQALDSLDARGFMSELWVGIDRHVFRFYLGQRGYKFRITATGPIVKALDEIGTKVLSWIDTQDHKKEST
jgi:hypothetical protein